MKVLSNKLNILLIILLSLALATLGFFSYKLIFEKDKIIVPDFSTYSETDINKWCSSLETNPCVITKEYSDTIEKDKVIYQSVSADEELDSKITIMISLGKNVEIDVLKIDKNTTKEDVEKWANDNALKNITYIEEESDKVEKNFVISIQPEKIINTDTEVKVYISTGKKETVNEEIVVNSGTYTNIAQSEFKNKVKELGLTPSHSSSRDEYSSNVEKGYIIWHGSGVYYKNEEIHYGLSLGPSNDEIIVEPGDYKGISFDDFKKKVEELGLVAKHNTNREDDYSDDIKENYILWHGSGTYEKGETITYTLSKGKKSSDVITIESGDYVGLSFDEFKKKVEALGLVTKHNESRVDTYSSSVGKDCILWHGSGTYEKGEAITYQLSLGSNNGVIEISRGQYVGKTLAEFESIAKSLGLTIAHSETFTDDYSDTIPKGYIDWHGYGEYVKGEEFHYTLSLGKENNNDTPVTPTPNEGDKVNVPSFANKDESDLLTFLTTYGLKGSKTSGYSNSIEKGKIITNTIGDFSKGATIEYKISLGIETATIMIPSHYQPQQGSTYEQTKSNLQNNSLAKFTNVTYSGEKSQKTSGQILQISVNGSTNYSEGEYPLDTEIKVVISTGYSN